VLVDWIVPFQEKLERVNDQFRMLKQLYPPTHKDSAEEMYLDIIGGGLERAAERAQSLVPDETLWAWINVSDMVGAIIGGLNALRLGFMGLRSMTEELVGADDPLLPLIVSMGQQVHLLFVVLQDLSQEQQEWFSPDTPLQAVTPFVAITVMLSVVSTEIAKPVPRLDECSHWPFVAYHPIYTYHLLCRLIRTLSRIMNGRRVIICPERTATHFVMKLTIRELHLTPALWERVIEALKAADNDANLELLYEMGGDLDPLTWDEGWGEGVIVRLPWANPA
jgi:hypothetical protein